MPEPSDEFSGTWTIPKKPNGYATLFDKWSERDVRALVRRDRNHPSVIAWSSGNEVPEQGTTAGIAISRRLTDIFHSEDSTRPVATGNNYFQAAISSRGEYFFPATNKAEDSEADFQVSSYDLYAVPWGSLPDKEFEAQDRNPAVAGEFVWTGFDYLGEPTPYNADPTNALNYSDPAQRARRKTVGRVWPH